MDHSDDHRGTRLSLPYQQIIKERYGSNWSQQTVAGLIVLNFCITCYIKQIDPKGTEYADTWYAFNNVFNVVFAIELIINLYGHWWCEFWSSSWNRFDFFVVAIGMLDMAWENMPRQMRMIRMLRAFRVLRLFSRVESMRKIIESLIEALPGVLNAFLILSILICIYAVLSVDFFRTLYDNCKEESGPDCRQTPRGKCWGDDYYGDFGKALYSMFQVLTGESWSEMAARPAIAHYQTNEDYLYLAITYLFFFSFVMINAFVLINVVVAVLMDGMASTADQPNALEEIEDLHGRLESQGTKIEWILRELSSLNLEVHGLELSGGDLNLELDAMPEHKVTEGDLNPEVPCVIPCLHDTTPAVPPSQDVDFGFLEAGFEINALHIQPPELLSWQHGEVVDVTADTFESQRVGGEKKCACWSLDTW